VPGADAKPPRPDSEHPAWEAQSADGHPDEPPPPPPPLDPPGPGPGGTVVWQQGRAAAADKQDKKEPLLEALDCFLREQPEKALALLKCYQQSSQDVYIRLLPVLAQLTHKGVDQLTPEEVSAIHEQLQGLAAELRPRARLVIDRVCFCEAIDGYGQYRALPEGHTFRAGGDQPGELVKLYVELRNFALLPCPQGYLTRLSSSMQICDAAGKQWWEYRFKEQEARDGPLYKRAPWQDCFGCYRFHMPHLPPGDYTLTVTIRDLTRPEAPPRVARKSIPLRVG
jgi:hypothetical protein